MVGSYQERQLGTKIASKEFYEAYYQVTEIHRKYREEHQKEWNKEHFSPKKLYKIVKEMGKIGKLRDQMEKDWKQSL